MTDAPLPQPPRAPQQPPGDPVALPDPTGDIGALALALVSAPSVSGAEGPLADAVQAALAARGHLEVLRHGNTVVARTRLGRPERIVVAGHLDTVPVSRRTGNVPGRMETCDGRPVVWGRGSVDMKGGVAVGLHLAATLTAPRRDVTWVFYDNEEVVDELNGLGLALAAHPDWFEADLAVLVTRFQTAGVPVKYSWIGRELPDDKGLQLTLFRIAQEAMTNILRYAPTTKRVEVTVSRHAGTAVLTVDNDAAPGSRPMHGSGKGLIGMRERAAVYGGTVDAGPTSAGWRVRAVLRWDEDDEGTSPWQMPL